MTKKQREKLIRRLVKTRESIYKVDVPLQYDHATVGAINTLIGELKDHRDCD